MSPSLAASSSMTKRRPLSALLAALAAVLVAAAPARAAIACESTADCATGETCVAGDSVSSIQQCVAGAVCGGDAFGACPSDESSGALACIWREGIYKCLSMDRCDEYFDAACSGAL